MLRSACPQQLLMKLTPSTTEQTNNQNNIPYISVTVTNCEFLKVMPSDWCCSCGENAVMWYISCGGVWVGRQQLLKWPPHHAACTSVDNMHRQSLSWWTQTGYVNHSQLWQDNKKHGPHLSNRASISETGCWHPSLSVFVWAASLLFIHQTDDMALSALQMRLRRRRYTCYFSK